MAAVCLAGLISVEAFDLPGADVPGTAGWTGRNATGVNARVS
jgi:hypothetical protein